ncbi:MAG: hypothetical protein GF308_10075 [Candidatus Heimdallarchaeota archaeon]|nr:hypothetical protein [Candidatus Heimdallarchaeota archaeon]
MENKKNNWETIVIRITCWVGAILDFAIAVMFTIYALSPVDTFLNQLFGYPSITPINYAIIAMLNGVMYAWAVLLLWVERKPLERRIVLAITAFPGAGGILIFNVIGLILGNAYIPIYSVIVGSLVVVSFLISFLLAQRKVKEQLNKKVIS